MSVTFTHMTHNQTEMDIVFTENDMGFCTSGRPAFPRPPPLRMCSGAILSIERSAMIEVFL